MSQIKTKSEGKDIKDLGSGENKMSEIIKTSLEGIRDFTTPDAAFGSAISTPSGVTIIPVSKITLGFASGGLDYSGKRNINDKSFGGGGGTAMSVTPIAFIAVGKNGEISMIPINNGGESSVDRMISLIERSPEIIDKIKGSLS